MNTYKQVYLPCGVRVELRQHPNETWRARTQDSTHEVVGSTEADAMISLAQWLGTLASQLREASARFK